MAKQIIINEETGLVVRTKINDNFTEVYGLAATNDADITALNDAVLVLNPAVATLQGKIIEVVNGNGGTNLALARPSTAAPVYWWNFGGKRPTNATDIDIIAGGPAIVDSASASLSLLPEWDGATIRLSNAAPTLTIPANITTALPNDYQVMVVSNNPWTLIAASGVTLNGALAPTSSETARPSAVRLIRDDANSWSSTKGSAATSNLPTGNVSGWYVAPWGLGQNSNTSALTSDTVYGSLFEIVVPTTVDQVVVKSGSGNLTGDQADLAIYAVSSTLPLPTGAPLWSSGAVAMGVASTVSTLTVTPPLVLQPGLYFFATNQNVARSFFTRRSPYSQPSLSSITLGSNFYMGFFGAAGSTFRKDTVTFGTWPTLTGAATDWTISSETFEAMCQFLLRSA